MLDQLLGVDLAAEKDTKLNELKNWDSLRYVRLVVAIEEKLGRELTDEEAEGLSTVGDVQALLSITN